MAEKNKNNKDSQTGQVTPKNYFKKYKSKSNTEAVSQFPYLCPVLSKHGFAVRLGE